MEGTVRNTNQWLLAAVLAALLVGATWYGVSVWRATASMPRYGNIILGVATILMLVSGCGLIALMFYSRRKGYDEPARSNRTKRE
jgi:heme/copper-type cytochrome/quinol oxidase subunit 2